MIYADPDQLKQLFSSILHQNLAPGVWSWLKERSGLPGSLGQTFTLIPRKTGKSIIVVSEKDLAALQSISKEIEIKPWTIDRFTRVCLLMDLDASEQEKYLSAIENLFTGAEMQELVALYTALPFLAFPEYWRPRCSEGIRSNIGDVLEAIMCNNPYPSAWLAEPAWNQLVLKAFFTEKPVHRIIGLDERRNKELANILHDFVHERWAANRPVNPQIWRCIGKFIDASFFPDIEKVFSSGDSLEKEAAALACYDSNYPPAKKLLDENAMLKQSIEKGELSWNTLAEKMMQIDRVN